MSIKSNFEKYHETNPQVYAMFKRFAFEAINVGYKILSANFIFERMRWETMVVTQGDCYKVNNNYRAYYARMFMDDHPQSDVSFRIRSIR
jgi:hypothetical protein